MKHFLAIFLVISHLIVQFSEGIIYFSFKINQDYIAKNLCVEKDMAGSTCKGCCQLKKKLDEQQQQKKQLPLPETAKNNYNLYAQATCNFYYFENGKKIKSKNQISSYRFTMYQNVFHPPEYNV